MPRTSMAFDEDNSFAACGSTFNGAIFMSNRATKRECLKRKLFGLPPSQTSFVKKIKSGMMLFLFEYEERKLYGVYQATCDGDVDISPRAFSSSGKPFSAQIRFKTVKSFLPLTELEFSDAIKDNYYTFNKFHFYLSREQVEKLLELFNSQGTYIQHSLSVGTGKKAMKQSRDYGLNSNIRVTVTNDNVENDIGMDSDIVPANLSIYPDLHRPNLNHLGYCKKSILNTNDFVGDGKQGLSLIIPPSSELPVLEIPSKSHNDGTVNLHASPHHDHPCYCRALSFQYRPSPLSLGVDDNLKSMQDITAYPQSLADNFFPCSRKQLYQCHTDPDDLNPSSTDYLSLDVTPNPEDYKISTFYEHYETSNASIPSSSRYFEKTVDSANLEGYEGFPFNDRYEHRIPILRTQSSGKECITGSSFPCSPRKDPSHLCDYHYLPASQHGGGHEEPEAWCHEPSAATFPSSEAENFGRIVNPLHFSSNRESLYEDGYGGLSFRHPMHHEEYCPVIDSGLQSDTYNKKTSVFLRLSVAAESSAQDDENYVSSEDVSASELNEQLSHERRKDWRCPLKNSKPWNTWISGNHIESTTDIDMSADDALDNKEDLGDSNETAEGGHKIPFLNFKRRSEAQKTAFKMETGTRVDGGYSGKKRPKLRRPSFSKESSPGEGTAKHLNVEGYCLKNCGSGAPVSVLNEGKGGEVSEW